MFAATAFSGVLPVGVRASNGSRARVRARATVAAPAGSLFGSVAGMRRTSAVDVIGASTYRGKTFESTVARQTLAGRGRGRGKLTTTAMFEVRLSSNITPPYLAASRRFLPTRSSLAPARARDRSRTPRRI